ncbi:protein ECERIFERUM 1-like [Papaver somniferum]|uniref:protein ECERIFERUM 1-like n=1 Tax=Papaver somniferum TaxID=3469 RepID=UPI000E6F95E3|nr:protein ECERIFERUM 1-like [Papaver somniferum]
MASKPGIVTDWPWKHLGSRFKYIVLAPWVVDSMYTASKMMIRSTLRESDSRDISWDDETRMYLIILPFLWSRIIHAQIWTSYSRFRTAKAKNRIIDKPIEFEQVDRESNWDDNIIFMGVIFYSSYKWVLTAAKLNSPIPFWRTDGVVMTILLHMGPVEFLYYWFHRALHHHFLYSRYHSHHHSSIVTEPVTSVIHPFGEHIIYFLLFAIPILTVIFTGTASVVAVGGYIIYIDFMNYLGHCNFELVTISYVFNIFPFLKYIFYTPSFHSLHHTQFRTNYSLFMPIYDLIYGTMDTSSDELYDTSLRRRDEQPEVVHLSHATTLDSVYHLRLGVASLASRPYNPSTKWYLMFAWPLTYMWKVLFGYTNSFVGERNTFNGRLNIQTWVVPKYAYQYKLTSQREKINVLIENAILEAEKAGVKVISLGLLNQDEELNNNGKVYLEKHSTLKIRIVDGSSLTVALVVNHIIKIIPHGTNQVIMRGKFTKVAYTVALILCQKGSQVVVTNMDEFEKLNLKLKAMMMEATSLTLDISSNLILPTTSNHAHSQVWLVGDGFSDEDQTNAPAGTFFVPFSQIPPWIGNLKNMRKDCVYFNTPAMTVPSTIKNIHSCEDWLPRRVMSASRICGIIHAMENWDSHECDSDSLLTLEDVEKVWVASLRHGFRPSIAPV